MSDEDLLIKLPVPRPPSADAGHAKTISIISLCVALVSAAASGIQTYEAHKERLIAESSTGPLLEITNAKFVSASSLFLTVRNIGRSPALSLECHNGAYVGSPMVIRRDFVKVLVPGRTYGPSIPVDNAAEVGVYMPDEKSVQKIISENKDFGGILELRGQIEYKGYDGPKRYLPFCYVVYRTLPIPSAGECNSSFDDIIEPQH